MFVVSKASKADVKLVAAMIGPSGSGKTFSAMRLASGLGGKIIVIDTQRQIDYYAEAFPAWDGSKITLPPPFSPEKCIEAIDAAKKAGAKVIVFDSISSEWEDEGGSLEIKSSLSGTNEWQKWDKVTPRHRAFINQMIASGIHLIATMQTKTAWMTEEYLDSSGNRKNRPVKVGLAPVQREGTDYRFPLAFNIEWGTHIATPAKCQLYGCIPEDFSEVITEATGKKILVWIGKKAPVKK